MQLTLDLPPREEQLAFNRRRWEEVCSDAELADLPGKIETNAYGQILMMPPASGTHSNRQGEIAFILRSKLGGHALPECPVSTIDGVRAIDVGWYSEERFVSVRDQIAFETAPEICVEVLSPSNTPAEMAAKRHLYFEAGAEEVWICEQDGILLFFHHLQPTTPQERSRRCPTFPPQVD